KGAWADPLMLTGYEFRMCVRLHKVTSRLVRGEKLSTSEREGWVSRYCVDMRTREVFLPQRYQKVQPHGWISIWAKDVVDAVDQMAVAVEVH
ncbi:MAG: nuclease, partial [Gemmatimonadota bacterium]